MTTLRIPHRFNGPPASANGGWCAGHLAREVDASAVTVRLRTPPPLDRDLDVVGVDDGSVELRDGDVLVATAGPATAETLGWAPLPPVTFDVADASGEAYEGLVDHPFPTCFSCGTGRDDGLGLRPGRVAEGTAEYAAAWVPQDVDTETVWAALDCPGGWSAGIAGRPMVLGTMTAMVGELPRQGEPHVVMAWPRGGAGRRFLSGTALYAADGQLLARAEATWVSVDPTSIGRA